MFFRLVGVPGGTEIAVHLHDAAALPVVDGGDVAAAVVAAAATVADAGHQAAAAAELGAAESWAGAAWTAALSQEWELHSQIWIN